MTLRASGLTGKPESPNGIFENEVFVDAPGGSGNYIGDFKIKVGDKTNFVGGPHTYDGATTDEQQMPWGWAHGVTGVTTGYTGGFGYLFQDFWKDCSNPTIHSQAVFETINAFFAVGWPTFSGEVIEDNSGPLDTPYKDDPACLVLGSGAQGGCFSWVGPNASLNPAAYFPVDTGWFPTYGQQWIFQGYFRAPAESGTAGWEIGFGGSTFGYPGTIFGQFEITEAWQFWQLVFTWPYGNTAAGAIPFVALTDPRFSNPEFRSNVDVPPFIIKFDMTKNDAIGAIEMKQVHLYTRFVPTGPFHIQTRV